MVISYLACGYKSRFVKGGISFQKFPLKDQNPCEKFVMTAKHIQFTPNKFSRI